MYRLIFRGEIAQGIDAAHAKRAVAIRFKLPEAQVDAMFSGRPAIIKRAQTCDELTPYLDALSSCGAIAVVEPEVESVQASPVQMPSSDAPGTAYPQLSAKDDARLAAIAPKKIANAAPGQAAASESEPRRGFSRLGPFGRATATTTVAGFVLLAAGAGFDLIGKGIAVTLIFFGVWLGSAITATSMRYSPIIAVGGSLIVSLLAMLLVLPWQKPVNQELASSNAEVSGKPALDPLEGVWTCNNWWIGYGRDGEHFRLAKVPANPKQPNSLTMLKGQWFRLNKSQYRTSSEVWIEGGRVMPGVGREIRWNVSFKNFDNIHVRAVGAGAVDLLCRRMNGEEQDDFFRKFFAR